MSGMINSRKRAFVLSDAGGQDFSAPQVTINTPRGENTQPLKKRRQLNDDGQHGSDEQQVDKATGSTVISPFLRLPPELRNTIYEMCLPARHEPLVICIGRRQNNPCAVREGSYAKKRNNDVRVEFLRTCKQIFSEAAPMLYQRNIVLPKWRIVLMFMGQIAHKGCTMLREVTLTIDKTHSRMETIFIFNALSQAVNLERLHLDKSWQQQLWTVPPRLESVDEDFDVAPEATEMARVLYKGAVHWFEAMAHHHKSPAAGMKILCVAPDFFYQEGQVCRTIPCPPGEMRLEPPFHSRRVPYEPSSSHAINCVRARKRSDVFVQELSRLVGRRGRW